MLKIYVSGIPLILASLFGFFCGKVDPYEKGMKQMNSIVNATVKQLNKRYGVVSIGRGGSEKEYKSSMESISFNLYRKVSKEEARILIIEIVELMLQNINNSQEISGFLYNNPFTYRNLQSVVFFYQKNGSDTYHPDMGSVSLTPWGTIMFVTYEPNEICKYATDVEEPYEEAYKIATGKDYPNPQSISAE